MKQKEKAQENAKQKGKQKLKIDSGMILLAVVLLLLIGNAINLVWIYYNVNPAAGKPVTALASTGIINFCIDSSPVIINNCSKTIGINRPYACQLNYSDATPNNQPILWSFMFLTTPGLFNLTSTGWLNFTPHGADIGNHSMLFFADDQSGCPTSQGSQRYNFTIIYQNTPPILLMPLPNVTFDEGSEIRPFFLNMYFYDYEGDALDYFSISSNSDLSINITNTSEVRMSAGGCGSFLAAFTAVEANTTESYSVTSNQIRVTINCKAGEGGGEGPKGGGGGGGGGGAENCTPKWKCQQWTPCLRNNTRYRICYDINGCDPDNYKKTLYQACEFNLENGCEEYWTCGAWSRCTNGARSRTCLDLNACGSTASKPNETEACKYPPTCYDGIKDGNETAVDCGGECPACSERQQPISIAQQAGNIIGIILGILLLVLLSLLVVARYYKKEIYAWLVKIGWFSTAHAPRTILLSRAELEKLLMNLAHAQKRYPLMSNTKAAIEYTVLARQYVRDALKIPYESTVEDIKKKAKEMGVHKTPTRLLEILMQIVILIEKGYRKPTAQELSYLFWELRTCMLMTSEIGKGEYHVEQEPSDVIPEIEKTKAYEELRQINSSIRHLQIQKSKAQYLVLVDRYNTLPIPEKENLYPQLVKTYCLIELAETIV